MFALVDCNNFYATCETLFRPELRDKPVVVLSNNDGCVVARSAQAKALGIKRGVPAYQIRELIERYGVAVFSSNYTLYADISHRVMRILEGLAPSMEVYSIDEAFLDVSGIRDVQVLGEHIRATIRKWTGVTVSVGIGPTKTLAKLASYGAKKYPGTGGVVVVRTRERQRNLMRIAPVGEVWGVGRRLTRRLQLLGIHTALDLCDCDPADMHQALSAYTEIACTKLRQEKQFARSISVFIQTSPFAENRPFYANCAHGMLAEHSNDSFRFCRLAGRLLAQIWRDGYAYNKGGVMLGDFSPSARHQLRLLERPARDNRQVMAAIDRINTCVGSIQVAATGIQQPWAMRRAHLSPAYTTCWQDLPRVR